MFRSLRNRLTLFFVGLAILPVITVSIILAQRSFTTLETEALDSQRQIARGLGAEIKAFVRQREDELVLISDVNGLATLDRDQQRSILNSLLASQQLYLEIVLLDATGQEHIRLSRFEVFNADDLTSRATSDEFQIPAQQGETYFSPVYLGEAEREPLITIAVPVFEPFSDSVNSILVADFRFRTIWDLIAAMEFGNEEDLYVIDRQGNVIAHSDPAVVLQGTTIELPENDGRATGLAGNEVIFARDTLQFGNQQLVVVAEQATSEALGLANNVISVATTVTIITLLIAGGLVVLTVRRVVRPIERLSGVARAIQQGDLTLRAEVTTRDEIGELAETFNNMTNRLEGLIGNLESRVAARTRDLQLAADVSKQINTLLNIDELLQEVVTLTSKSFRFHSTFVYLLDENNNRLVRAAGADAKGIGFELVEREAIAVDAKPSVIAQAARTREVVVVNDVTSSPLYLSDRALPGIRSELAIPLLAKNQLLGVFDMQSPELDRFKPEDINVLATLAEQIAIAVRNANLFSETQAAQRAAEEANQVKSKFLANMSHELRTPLNSILNFTELVADGDLGEVNPDQREVLQEVVDNGVHLLSLINDVLDITKIEVGMMELFVQQIDVNSMLESVEATAKVLVKDNPNVQIVMDVQPDLPVISGDRRRVRQMLLNLISNAAKFTSEGQITISARCQDHELQLAVSDTGVGIAPEDQETIFESFRQTERGLFAGTGAGLGLAITRHLAELHGGHIRLESALDQGSTFHIALPLQPAAILETAT